MRGFFSYICREGTTRRWMCHCFIATRDSGERLSHAVGCAFTACLQRKQKAQALQAQAKKDSTSSQDEQAASTATATVTTTTTTTTTSGAVATPPPPPPQQTTLKQLASAAPVPTSMSPVVTGADSSMNGPTLATTSPQPVVQLQQQPQQLNTQQQPATVQPVLKPPPPVTRARPQQFAPSPFTRHMSLRYKSTPMSLGPLKDNVKGYESLQEEPQAPKLPPTVDALVHGTTTQVQQQSFNYPAGFVPQATTTSPGFVQSTPMYNGLQSTNAMNTSYSTPVQNVANPAQPFGAQASSPWTPSSQIQRTPSDAEKWLESAENLNKVNGGNQGLLTTVNPFSPSTQNNVISGTWTQDMNVSLPATRQTNQNAWGKSSIPTVPEEDEFASLATRHTGSPLGSPTGPSKNPFSQGSQVYWV